MKKKYWGIAIFILLVIVAYQLIDVFFSLNIVEYSQVVNGILSPILGVITIYLIYKTWRETEKSNKEVKISNEVFREQAYIQQLLAEIEALEKDINLFTIDPHQGIKAFENVTGNSKIYHDQTINRNFVIILQMTIMLGRKVSNLSEDCPNTKTESIDFIKLKYARFINKYIRPFIEKWRKDFEDHMVILIYNDRDPQDNDLRLDLISKLEEICRQQIQL